MNTSTMRSSNNGIPSIFVVALITIGIFLSIVSVDGIQPGASTNGRSANTLWNTPSLSSSSPPPQRCFRTRLYDSAREDEIRKKIEKLKEEGKLGNGSDASASPDGLRDKKSSAYDDYADKVQGKLGKRKGQILGFTSDYTRKSRDSGSSSSTTSKKEKYDIDDFIAEEDKMDAAAAKADANVNANAKELELENSSSASGSGGQQNQSSEEQEQDERGRQVSKMDARGRRVGRIGTLPEDLLPSEEEETTASSSSDGEKNDDNNRISIDPALFDLKNTDPDPPEMSEEELVELVAERLAAKRAAEDAEIEAEKARKKKERELEASKNAKAETETTSSSGNKKATSTGVGGSWSKNETKPEADYTPKVGGWGVFARPKSISQAYGGGRRIGAGYDNVDAEGEKLRTKKLLKDYRKKVGIEVPTEKEHAAEIEEALSIGQRAMQRGVYATAVSVLEKVTIWCSTNSKVGSKVYLELAMAYEACGRTKEAAQIYNTLTDCRMEDVKYSAKQLLYGLEAMEVMREVSPDFNRKKSQNAFIDATGLDNFASNFDDVYQTAYVDMDSSFYKKLTESVVRSVREARQILIQARGKGEVSRTRIVQALRCINRNYEELLSSEIDLSKTREPTAFLNGKPIEADTSDFGPASFGASGDFQLLGADEMIRNMDGEWRLQLLADKQGDGVSFFNTSTAIQRFSTKDTTMTFSAEGPSGLTTEKCSGKIEMNASKRLLSRAQVESSNTGVNGILSMIGGGKNAGFSAAVSRDQQIVSVDSLFFITRRARSSRGSGDLDKEYFTVWRRVFPEDNE